MLVATEEQKRALRKIKGVAGERQDIARNTLVKGCLEQGAYIQFGRDMAVYNLWEALLFAQGYEEDGMYKTGSAQAALDAVLKWDSEG
jgi:hypothetical protein